jgi:hypothetical protein
MGATYSTNLIILGLIIVTHCSPASSNIVRLGAEISPQHSVITRPESVFSVNARGKVPYAHWTAGRVTDLHNPILIFWMLVPVAARSKT